MHTELDEHWKLGRLRSCRPADSPDRLAHFNRSFAWFLDAFPLVSRSGDLYPDKSWTVLEAGQGLYGWSSLYKVYFSTVYGADLVDTSKYHPGVKTLVCDFTDRIPLGDGAVDLIVSHSVLEHVQGIYSAVAEFNRILKDQGLLYLTISPLYFSPTGSHITSPYRLEKWEHLDPRSEFYLLDDPFKFSVGKRQGTTLNKVRLTEFLACLSGQAWSIERYQIKWVMDAIPEYVDRSLCSEVDLRARGVRVLLSKQDSNPIDRSRNTGDRAYIGEIGRGALDVQSAEFKEMLLGSEAAKLLEFLMKRTLAQHDLTRDDLRARIRSLEKLTDTLRAHYADARRTNRLSTKRIAAVEAEFRRVQGEKVAYVNELGESELRIRSVEMELQAIKASRWWRLHSALFSLLNRMGVDAGRVATGQSTAVHED